MTEVIGLPRGITWCNDFSYTERPNQIEKITSDHLNHFSHLQMNTSNTHQSYLSITHQYLPVSYYDGFV